MRHEFFSILIAVVLTLLTVNYIVLAFSEPAAPPPNENAPAPINVGPDAQSKTGNLQVNELSAAAISLGGDRRTVWPGGAGGGGGGDACTWQGVRCECFEDNGGAVEGKIILALACLENPNTHFRQIAGFDIIDFHVTAGNDSCPNTPPPGCDFYVHN